MQHSYSIFEGAFELKNEVQVSSSKFPEKMLKSENNISKPVKGISSKDIQEKSIKTT